MHLLNTSLFVLALNYESPVQVVSGSPDEELKSHSVLISFENMTLEDVRALEYHNQKHVKIQILHSI